jgi:hypothetical protein
MVLLAFFNMYGLCIHLKVEADLRIKSTNSLHFVESTSSLFLILNLD